MKSIFAAILLISVTIGLGQNKTVEKKEVSSLKSVVLDSNVKSDPNVSLQIESESVTGNNRNVSDYSQIFTTVEINAQPKEGIYSFRKFVSTSFRTPEVDNYVEATIHVRFVVFEDGSLNDFQILKETPIGLGLGKEAIRVLKTSQNWIPGQVNGKKVKQYYTFPIRIQIQGLDEDTKPNEEIKKQEAPIDSEKIVDNISVSSEKQAEPTGGIKKFYTDLSSKIQVPEVEVPGNYKTKVKFLVNQDGSLSDFLVMEETPQNVGLGLNVIKYLQSYGNWMPGEQNGKKVKTYFILPVTLNIEPEIESNTNKKN